MTGISLGYLVAALVAQTAQTTLIAFAWLPILRYAYPDAEIPFRPVLASYAVGVALNGFLPANIGTFVMMFLFLTFIPGSTFPGVFAGWLVHKIFFTLAGGFVYLYLFLSVPGSFDIELGNISSHPFVTAIVLAGGAFLLVLLGRLFWKQVKKLWEKAKAGGAILSDRPAYFGRVFLPEFLGWTAKLAVTGLFLAAYGIPVTFHTIMSVVGGNSLANVASFTPGAVGITQAVNAASLENVTDADDGDGVLARPAADRDRVEPGLRDRAPRLGVRLDGRQAARARLVRGGEGEGRRTERRHARSARRRSGRHGTPPSSRSPG